ncbi:MAG: S-adenosylmethionine-dependent methyltransferase [Defluviitaleaceae bacterium]|jgi:ubiquinone/menaquinone biosynthesis C-methylase UbiE|nr:S-adenosylmethionine-dependent methyltransferase [Defluviitaleaceae bacterium]HHW68590.1 class I SAM-dependent methyltransferase [Candidatus Epulonipiscium sp.]
MNKVDAKEKTRRHFNETADHYVDSHDGKFVQHMYTSLLKELEKFTSGKLLDIGCGNGDFLGLIKDRGLELHGIDLAENMVKVAKKRYGDIAQIILGDAENLPYEEGMFDVIICNASFHHYTNPRAVLAQMRRVLKNNGVLLIGDPWMPQPLRGLMNYFTRFSNEGDFHYYGKEEMRNLMNECSFRLIDSKKTGKHTILFKAIPML